MCDVAFGLFVNSSISLHVTVGCANYYCQLQLAKTAHLLIRGRQPLELGQPSFLEVIQQASQQR